jgi:hypothetical protein
VDGDGARATARVAGDDERSSGEGLAAVRGWNGGGCDHEPQGRGPSSGYREAAVARSCPTAAGPRAFARRVPENEPAVVRAGGRGWGGGLSILGLPPRPSTTAGIRSPGPLHLLLGFDTARGRVRAVIGGESQPECFTWRRISPRERDVGLQSAGSRPRHLQGAGWCPRRRRASRSARHRPALRAWSGRPASPGCSARDRERW